ncbi:hypothetical protein CCASP_01125 [Corynebacterium caspium DSM 44850]|nr:hypothetical protein CCASP_01125 [Corynebacterium caspium DSM 44850]
MSTRARLHELDKSMSGRAQRVRKRIWHILQSGLGAALAYWFATEIAGHANPFFAPISAVIIIGLNGGDRTQKALELSFGCVLGVGFADLIIPLMGEGVWQLSVAVMASLAISSFLSASPLVSNQMAIGAILIATMLPVAPTAQGANLGPDRMIDAIVGSVVALLVTAVMPNNPLAAGRQEIANVLGIASSVLGDVAKALRTDNQNLLEDALMVVRDTQADIDRMLEAAKVGKESTTISPLMWTNRRRVRTLERIISPLDNCLRNCRVLVRRAYILTEDQDKVSENQIQMFDELSEICLSLANIYESRSNTREAIEIPVAVNHLRLLGARSGLENVEGRVLSAYALLAQTRSIIVDLMQVCGMSRESAIAVLAPTSSTPAYPPEIWEQEN